MNILISGGTGFIGQRLSKDLFLQGHKITILTRSNSRVDSDYCSIEDVDEIDKDEQIDYIINLAGAPIDKRWSENYKQTLIDSRVGVTSNLIELIKKLDNKPKKLISASAIGFYGTSESETFDENSPNGSKNEFAPKLCKLWEDEALKSIRYGVDVNIIRLGVVLGEEGALKKMVPPFKLGLGGKLGNGKQYFSWIHIDDVIQAINFITSNQTNNKIFNLTSPNCVTNSELTKAIGKVLQKPTIFCVPSLAIKTIFGQMGEELLLKGQKVLPNNLTNEGFNFKYESINKALRDIL